MEVTKGKMTSWSAFLSDTGLKIGCPIVHWSRGYLGISIQEQLVLMVINWGRSPFCDNPHRETWFFFVHKIICIWWRHSFNGHSKNPLKGSLIVGGAHHPNSMKQLYNESIGSVSDSFICRWDQQVYTKTIFQVHELQSPCLRKMETKINQSWISWFKNETK